MINAMKLEISTVEKFKLLYVNFFPVIFLPFISIYMFNRGDDPKEFFLTNTLIGVTVILVPFLLAVCMYITKILYKDKCRDFENASIGLGGLCTIFLLGFDYYQFSKFAASTIEISKFNFSLFIGALLACFVSSVMFSFKYITYSKSTELKLNQKVAYFIVAALPPLIVGVIAQIIF